ncbi:hypothetical protein [Salipiger bermudensis]|uniref:hypothetical protein n=1 Tax=Salipiger bermudensis TaxID=344736 RepID=UPI001A90B0D0|nr:hypothetical protein [Salipiger bermudensis]MBN9678813.1 hypothetical protein [Salipiger bermudensis]
MTAPPLILDLAGPVRLQSSKGEDLTPKLTRSRAVLALLGASEGHVRSRTWIQDKLWSDKPGPEAAAALRYVLWDIRKALGKHRSGIASRNGNIALDRATFEVRCQTSGGACGRAFAEGLDVDDPEFEAWLRDQRAMSAARLEAPPSRGEGARRDLRSMVWLCPDGGDDDALQGLAHSLAVKIAARLKRSAGAIVRIDGNDIRRETESGIGLRCNLRLSRLRGRILAQVSLTNLRSGMLAWTNDRDLPKALSAQDPLNPFANLMAERIAHELASAGPDATEDEWAASAYSRALLMPRSFRGSELQQAVETLGTVELEEAAALSAARRALYLGWMVIERRVDCPQTALETARSLSRRAIELDPTLSEAFAIRAELADFDRKPELAYDLARHAVQLDPFDPIAVAALAKAEARVGNAEAAYKRALYAQQLALGFSNPAWWASLCCTTALQRGDAELALRHAETACDLAPGFLPPLRFLAALRFMKNDLDGCRGVLLALSELEHGFTPEHFTDPDYPVRSVAPGVLRDLRQAKLV